MSNFFDKFDAPQKNNQPNYFDQFDSDPSSQGESGIVPALGAGIDKLQEIGYRAVKGFTDVGVPKEEQTNALGRAIGQGGSLSKWADEGIQRNLEEQRAYSPSVASYKDIDSVSDAASYVGELTAQSVPMMAAALSPAGLFAMGGGLSNDAYEAQPEDDKQPWRAAASGFGQAALERLGVEASIGRLFKGQADNVLTRVGKSALGEGVTETGQEAIAQWGEGKSLDEIENLDEAFVGGALVGGTIRGGAEAGKQALSYKEQKPELSEFEETDLTENVERVVPDPFEDIGPAQNQENSEGQLETIPGETVGDTQPNWQFGQNDMPYRGAMEPYTYSGEYEQYREAPNSVPVGAVLEAPVIEGEFERPRGLPNRADTIIAEDGRPLQRAQEFAEDIAQISNRALSQKDIIFGEDSRNVQVKRNGQPFGGRRAAQITKEFRQAQEQGLNPQVIEINGGYGWVAANKTNTQSEQVGDPNAGNVDDLGAQRNASGGDEFESADASTISGTDSVAGRESELEGGTNSTVAPEPSAGNGQVELVDDGRQPNDDPLSAIDIAANEAATSPMNERPEPTDAQKEAGNYKKGKVRLHGLDISIENPRGSIRKGKDQDGKEWSSEMKHHYGDIKGTTGADGDSIDVFIGDKPESQRVFVVDQIDPKTGEFDEVKVMMGFDDAEAAKSGYLSNYDKNWKGLGEITEASVEDFKAWTKRPRKSKQPFALPAKPKKEESVAKDQEDWGEKITTARKNISVRWHENSTDDEISSKPLSKTWPEKEFDDVGDTYASAFAFAARGEIPRKPNQPYKKRGWVEKVKSYRQLVKDNVVDGLLTGKITKEKLKELGGKRNLQDFFAKVDLLSELDRKDWGKVERVLSYPDSMDFNPKTEKLDIPNPKTYVRINSRNREFNSTDPKVLAEKIKPFLDEKVDKPKMKFEVRGRNGSYFINKKGDPEYTRLATFESSNEAFDFIRNNNSKLVESWESHKARVNVTKADIRNKVNKPRTGEDYRNGKDATAEDFQNTFGIKRGTFGKWVKQGKERQDMLNGTYDALMDLANITGVPPRALSLEGKLGFAFGANGRGKAMAHYEPGEVVINLTKTKGAGSLAHEWFHALDNYFQKKRDTLQTTEKGNFITHNPETYYIGPRGYSVLESRFRDMRGINKNEWRRVEGVRPEVAASFKNLVDTLNGLDFAKRSSRLDKGKAGGYWSSNLEMAARAFESYVIAKMNANGYNNDFLANVTSESDFKRNADRYPYIKANEIAEVETAFDELFNTIESKENIEGDVALFSSSETSKVSTEKDSLSLSNANDLVARFVRGISGAQKDYVSVVSSFENLPAELKKEAEAQGAKDRVKGALHDGKVYIVLEQHSSKLDLEKTLFHEVYGHAGIKKLFGNEVSKKLNALFVANGGLKGLRKTAKRHGINLERYIEGIERGEMTQEVKNRVLMEELLAHMQESNTPSIKRLTLELIGMVKKRLRKLGLPGLSKLSDSDLFYLLKQTRTAAEGKSSSDSNGDTLFRTTGDDSPFTMPEETWTDNALRFIQDKFNRVKRAQDTVRKAGISVSDSADVYGVESLYYGKVEEDFRQLAEKYLEPMAEKMAKHNIKQEELDLFLYALHAPERNAHIRNMDKGMDSGSGMTDNEARRILDAVNRDPRRKVYTELQSSVREMIDQRTQQMFEQGLIDEETFSGFRENYKYYVPLKGQAKDEGGKPKGNGMGFNIKGKESIAALGRKSKAESPLLHAYLDTQRAITRGHKNEVGNALLNLIEEAPNPDLWNVYTTEGPLERKKVADGSVQMVAMSSEKMSALSSNPQSEWFATKREGVEYYIKIDDPILAMQMKNVGVDNGNRITQALGAVNRFLSMMATSANPEFLITNVTRDVQTALYNLAAESDVDDGKLKGVDIKALTKNVLRDMPKALAGIRRALRENKTDTQWSQIFDDFRKSGAKTGYFDMKDIETQSKDLQKLMKLQSKGGLIKYGKAALKFIEDYNSAVENTIRLSVYKNAIDAGISEHQAAVVAKNLTVNFNRKGQAGTWLNSLYLFANAGIQGTANFARAIGTFKTVDGKRKLNLAQKAGIAMAGIGFSMALLNRLIAGEDDDGESYWEKVPEHVKERNFVLMVPGSNEYITFPMPYGYNIFANFGTAAESIVSGGEISKNAGFVTKAAMGSFLPIGLSEGGDALETSVKTIMPQIGKPFIDLATNSNFFGSAIFSEANEKYGSKKSDAGSGFKSTNEFYKQVAMGLNEATGGSEYQSGLIDVHPETVRYMLEYIGSGASRFVLNTSETITRASQGEFDPARTPFVRRFYGKTTDHGDSNTFFERLDEIETLQAELKSLKGPERLAFRKEHQDKLRLSGQAKQTQKRLKQLRKRLEFFKDKDDKENVKKIEEQMESTIDRFNLQYNALKD